MTTDFMQRLTATTTDDERAAVLLEMSLSALSLELQTAVYAAAIPHWFDVLFLDALLGEESDDLYVQLMGLSFVEQLPERGYAVHERTRQQVLATLWRDDPDHYRVLSRRAADYCARKTSVSTMWSAEELYHRLLSDPEAGVATLRGLVTKWANYEYHTYEEIEWAVRLANEQIEAGRLTGVGADWVRLWQAKLALIYGRPDLATDSLARITLTSDSDPALAAEVAQTEGDVLAKTEDREGMAAAWRRAYDLYQQVDDGQLDAYLVMEKLRQEGLPLPAMGTAATVIPTTPPSRDALRLIDNIKAAWIEGVLETALDEKIDLGMTRDGGHTVGSQPVGRRPANLVYHRPQQVDRPLLAGQRLSGLFEAAGNSLLILGAPGSGKTITLLQLLAELLERARQDREAPIPLLFNLSSFANFARDKETDLAAWLAEQAYNQYRLKRQTTREQLQQGRFVLLLDGLDEVTADEGRREQCVLAINDFMQQMPCGLIVCSRIGDYQTLQNRLALAHALVLQPLGNRQIEAFIAQQDKPHQAAMQAAIAADWQLREALRSPLLLNLYPQAFPAMTAVAAQTNGATDTVEIRRQALFAAYVETVFDQPTDETRLAQSQRLVLSEAEGLNQSKFPKEKSMGWLRFLANRMQQAGTTLFYVEELQPTWLPEKLFGRFRAWYGLFHGVFFGLLFGLLVGFISAQNVGQSDEVIFRLFFGLSAGMIIGLLVGLLSGGGGALAVWLTSRVKQGWLRVGISGLSFGLSSGVILGLILWLIVMPIDRSITGVFFGLLFGLTVGLGMMVSNSIAGWMLDIHLREQVRPILPNWRRVIHYVRQGFLYGLIGGLVGGLIIWFYEKSIAIFVISVELNYVPVVGLIVGLIGVVSAGLMAFLDIPEVDERPHPGLGVRASLWNATLMICLATLFFGPSTWLLERGAISESFLRFLVLVIILPPTFTWFGGLAWCQHWALRFMLWRRGWLPWRLVLWLEEMVARELLRRVGGGYIFIHRSLLEYFAALGDDNG